ncbi:unnamed protein product [Ixodes hexagonus]
MGLLLPFDDAERVLNTRLKPHLNSIHVRIKKDNEVTTRNVDILNNLLEHFCKQMKLNDPLFKLLFKRFVYTGSYYDGLRTKCADEFDINLVLVLPLHKGEFTYTVFTLPKAYAASRYHHHHLDLFSSTSCQCARANRCFHQNRFVPDRVKRWLQSVVARTLLTYVPSESCAAVAKIRPKESGPATTFLIDLIDGSQIDVDLVPVIEFRYPDWPDGIKKAGWMTKISAEHCNWFLIPKQPKAYPHLWRLHFPNMEKKLIEDYGCIKPIIRLLKTLRDAYKWNLSSYSLKTFVMNELVANDDRDYWDQDNQGMLFVRVLGRLGLALKQPGLGIPFLFHPEVDVTEKVKRETRDNIGNAIERIVRKLRESPDKCIELILKDKPGTKVPSNSAVEEIPSNDVWEAEFIPDEARPAQNSGSAWRCTIM